MVCGIRGLCGMNFDHVPEPRWTYGYPATLSVTALACLFIHRGFPRNGRL